MQERMDEGHHTARPLILPHLAKLDGRLLQILLFTVALIQGACRGDGNKCGGLLRSCK